MNPTLTTHMPAAIAVTNLFPFHMTMLAVFHITMLAVHMTN